MLYKMILLAVLISCTSHSGDTEKDNETIKIRLPSEPATLDWNRATDTTSRQVILALMTPLIDYEFGEDGSFELRPGLFASWESKDQKVWHFKLAEDRHWSDGQPLSAQHIVDSLERLLKPDTGAPNAFYFFSIRGAKDFNTGKIKDFSEVGIKILEEGRVLEYQLTEPLSFFPMVLSLINVLPIRKEEIAKDGGDHFNDPSKIKTLGPYNLVSWSPHKNLRIKANPHAAFKPKTEEIEFMILEDQGASLRLFEQGSLDVLLDPSLKLYEQLAAKEEFHEVQDHAVEYLGFNLRHPLLKSKSLRRAMVQSIDKKEMLKAFQGGFTPLYSWLPKGILSGGAKLMPEFSLEESTQWKSTTKPEISMPLRVYTYQDEDQLRLLQSLQAQWKRNLGIDFSIETMDWKSYLNKVNTDPPGIFRLGWLSLYPDPDLLMSLFLSNAHFNTSGFASKEYDELVRKARYQADPSVRKKLYLKAQKILLEDEVAVFPLYNGARRYLIQKDIKGLGLNPMNMLHLHRVEKVSKR